MTFEELLAGIRRYPIVTDDTREFVAGGVFVYGGGRASRDEFLAKALALGATVVVAENGLSLPAGVELVRVTNRRATGFPADTSSWSCRRCR